MIPFGKSHMTSHIHVLFYSNFGASVYRFRLMAWLCT